MKRMMVTILSLCVVLYGQEKIDKRFDGIQKIDMEIASGNCQVVKSSSSKVRVTLEGNDNRNQKFIVEKRGKKLIVKERKKGGDRYFWGSSPRSEWRLELPNSLDFEFSAGSGDIEITGVSFEELQVSTGSGKIELEKVKGDTELNTGSGRLRIETFSGQLSANTGSGNIQLKKFNGRVRANTGSGDIEGNTLEGGFRLNTGSGEVFLTDAKVLNKTSINTGSGDIEVTLAAQIKSDISLNAGSGDIELAYNGNKIEGYIEMKAKRERRISAPFKFDRTEREDKWGRNYVIKSATIGSDDIEISLSTGSGRVSIKK